ncbi:unnamed protein product, partial [Didymodactylos carnosus]
MKAVLLTLMLDMKGLLHHFYSSYFLTFIPRVVSWTSRTKISNNNRRESMPIQHEYESEAHRIFRSYKSHTHQDQTTQSVHEVPGIVQPGSTGVLYVTDRAMKNGFTYGANDWANFGQGAPETGQIE